jgi:hypothetical protein
MTQDEQKQLDLLREQLGDANRNAEQTRVQFSSALVRSNTEARLYRGLFWCLLALTGAATILHVVQR